MDRLVTQFVHELQLKEFYHPNSKISNEDFINKFRKDSIILARYLATISPFKQAFQKFQIDNRV